MTTYAVYYLTSPEGIEAGPFPTVKAAVHGMLKFTPPFQTLLKVVKGKIEAEPV